MVPNNGEKDNLRLLMETAILDCVAPAVLEVKQRLVERTEKVHGRDSAEAAVVRDVRPTLSFDGEDKYLAATIQEICINPPPALRDQVFMLVKFAAAASKFQQPCDVSPSYMVLKALIKSLYGCPEKAQPPLSGP